MPLPRSQPNSEPQRPKPETFDLTDERLAKFDEDADQWFVIRLFVAVFVLIWVWMIWEFFARGGPSAITTWGALPGLLFMGFLGLAMAFGAALFLSFPGGLIFRALWKLAQHDYPRVRLYKRAMKQYAIDYAAWLKTQRFWWDSLHPRSFEQEVAAFFQKQGHRVE